MTDPNTSPTREPIDCIDPSASAHDLLNDANEWLQYALSLTELLAEVVRDFDVLDRRRLSLMLDAVGALTRMGVQCAAHGHTRMHLEQLATKP